MTSLRNVISCSVMMLIAASAATADDAPIRHAELGLEFRVPSGYVVWEASEPDLLFAFGRPNAEQTANDQVLVIRRLGKLLPRKETPDDLRGESGKPLPVTRMSWKDFDLWAARTEGVVEERSIATWVVLVPTSPESIRVTFSGAPTESEGLKRQLQDFLATLDGKSNWLSDQERRDRVVQPIVAIVVVVTVLVLLYRRHRHSPNATATGDGLDAGKTTTE